MPVPDEATVKSVLAKHGRDSLCRGAVEDAWAIVRKNYPDVAWWRRKSTRAGIMWEQSVQNVIAALDGTPDVKIISHHDTVSIIFDDLVLARLKKASIQLRTSNYPTPMAQLFHQHQEEDLFGFKGHHRVEIAHVLNRFGTELDWIGVVARERDQVLWHFEFGATGGAVVEQFPLQPKPAPAAERVLRSVTHSDTTEAEDTSE